MAEVTQTQKSAIRPLNEVLKEIQTAVQTERLSGDNHEETSIKDLRWKFDQVSATMNQAIYNDHPKLVRETCLNTIKVLVEILSRTASS